LDHNYKKIDFHVHTPVSKCYSESGVTFDQISEAAASVGLDAIVISDHNAFEAVAQVKESAEAKGLIVFPGVELSTGGGHVLGIFDIETPGHVLEDLLEGVGVPREARGNGTIMTGSSLEDVFLEIDGHGGIAVAAHIERWPSGFLETNESRKTKQAIHNNPHLSALEITQPQNRDLWRKGKMRTYPKKYACIQGSDAHALADIGRRPTYVKMPEISLDHLRAAFQGDNAQVRFPEEMV
jgi:hypothetical protein